MDAQTLVDRAEISDLLEEYAHAIDTRDFDRVASVFTQDAVLDYTSSGGPRGTRDELVEWLRAALPAVALTQHLLTNRRIRVEGDTATAGTELFNPLLFDGEEGTQLLLLGGSYSDRLVRTVDGWRIVERVHTTTWTAGPWPAQLASQEGT